MITLLDTLARLRLHDFRAARTWIAMRFSGSLPLRLARFAGWALKLILVDFHSLGRWVEFARPVSRTPIWLDQGNPFDNHPFDANPEAKLPDEVDVVVIGAGLIGSALAYHWSKLGVGTMLVLEKDGVASGAAGRNEGLVVMGRYYQMVQGTVLGYLNRARGDLSESERRDVAAEFADSYCRAAYANAEMIAETVEAEGIECDYERKGWVQGRDEKSQQALDESLRMAEESGFVDWTRIPPEEAFRRSGMRVEHAAGFSKAAATWHPAKWCWGLTRIALASERVKLFTRTRVKRVEDEGEHYRVKTSRGTVRARSVVNATESATPRLFPRFHDIIQPMQTQAAFGESDGGTMKAGVGISSETAFFGRHGAGVLFGSDATRVSDRLAGSNRPSRFITRFVLTQMKPLFGIRAMRVTHEWSGTVSYTPDEFPIVGLMDTKRLYIIGGMAGSGSAVSFNAARHVVQQILGIEGPNYYPERYFSPARFQR